jgi:tetratricopeptide (TPR) repeat protein
MRQLLFLPLLALCSCSPVQTARTPNPDCNPDTFAPATFMAACSVFIAPDKRATALTADLSKRALERADALDFQASVALLDRAIALEPDAVDLRWERARGNASLGTSHFPDVRSDLEAAVAVEPDNGVSQMLLGSLLQDMGESAPARQHLDRAVELLADAPQAGSFARGARCWARATAGTDLDGALADCNARLQLAPDSANVLDARAFVHFRRGEWREAIADYDRALARDPELGAAYFMRGLARRHVGDKQGAAADLREAWQRDPGLAARYAGFGIAEAKDAGPPAGD